MVKSRQREQRDRMIIRTKKNWFLESTLYVLSLFIWIYVVYALLFYITAFFNLYIEEVNVLKIILNLKNKEVVQFAVFVLQFFFAVTAILYLWAVYNRRRYGPLNRRKYPKPTSVEDIIKLDYIERDVYEDLQNAKMITFQKNPITDKKVE